MLNIYVPLCTLCILYSLNIKYFKIQNITQYLMFHIMYTYDIFTIEVDSAIKSRIQNHDSYIKMNIEITRLILTVKLLDLSFAKCIHFFRLFMCTITHFLKILTTGTV